ncbi:MAG: MotA/TolQ/ExbB proton channel family protein [Chromatiales bacterium]|jgi:biopolymer transport protein ExbB/TolQ
MSLDSYLYELSNLFLLPVQIGVVLLFVFSLYSLGAFTTLYAQRNWTQKRLQSLASLDDMARLKGYSMLNLLAARPDASREDMELAALKELDYLRITTRIAPMLGLVATMIPMGPALKSLANGNVQGISENLIIAFTAVIFALLAASITFWIASVRKQWLAHDIRFAEDWRDNNARHFEAVQLDYRLQPGDTGHTEEEVASRVA